MSLRRSLLALLLCGTTVLGSACRKPADDAPAMLASPEVRLDRSDAAVSSPIEMTYRFAALPGVTLTKNYTVFVHVVDADGELMWTDDHEPPVPTTQWKAGVPVQYARTMFVPKFPYEGAASVEVGLYDPATGERVKMDAESPGQRAYRVASFGLRLQSDAPFVVFTDGWHAAEVSGEATGVEWQWTKKEGTLAFKNPGKDATLYLQLDQPVATEGSQHVEVRLGTAVIDAFDLMPGPRELRKVAIAKDQFGTTETVSLVVAVDKTFVPATIPALKSNDTRELGVRVFRAYLQPK